MYFGINTEAGKQVEDEDAYAYALENCLNGSAQEKKEFREMLVEWYFSGDWLHKEGNANATD